MGVNVHTNMHTDMLLLMSESHEKTTALSVFMQAYVRPFTHAHPYVNIHNSWPGRLALCSHWLPGPCKHTPTCYWFILSNTHSTRSDHSQLAGREAGGDDEQGEGNHGVNQAKVRMGWVGE